MECNQTIICGKITRLSTLRYTPAGVAVLEFEMRHTSQQIEASIDRQVICSISAIVLGEIATTMTNFKIGDCVKLTGFMANKSRNNQQLILHVHHVAKL